MSNDPIAFSSRLEAELKTDGLLSIGAILRVVPDNGGRIVLRLPMGGSRSEIEVVLGGPDSSPTMARALREMANKLDRAHQDYHMTGAGILRKVMDGIRATEGAEHAHLDSITFRAVAGMIEQAGTDHMQAGLIVRHIMRGLDGTLKHRDMEPVRVVALAKLSEAFAKKKEMQQ